MKKLKRILSFVFPLILIGAVGYGIYYFETAVKYNLVTKEIVLAKHDIPYMKEITADDLIIQPIFTENIHKQALEANQMDQIIGKYSKVDIKEGMQLNDILFTEYNLIPSEDEFLAPVPKEWIFAITGSIKKGHLANLYVIKNVSQFQSLEEDVLNTRVIHKPIVEEIKVSSVRDAANNEIALSNETMGAIQSIEVMFNQQQLETVKDYMEKNYKLYITYVR